MVERRPWLTALSHAVLIIGVLVVAFPLYLTFVASTHTVDTIIKAPMPLWPGTHLVENYTAAWNGTGGGNGSKAPVGQMMMVSAITALVIALGKIAISLLSAFAIVYFRFPFRMFFFWAIFVTLMLPVEVRILPTYKVVADLGLLNSYAGLTVPLIASATATFLFRQFFLTVPEELTEAARMDGAGPMRFFIDILVPLSKTSMAALFVIQFIYGWNPLNHHQRKHVPGSHRHQTHDLWRRRANRMERGDGHCFAGHDSTGAGGDADAEVVC
jgi:sn-glycerol 3-phosphate transport system permease protein